MSKYPKIQSLYKRDPKNNYKTFLDEYSRPEFALLEHAKWIWTEKIDGMNIRVIWDGESVQFRGRTDKAQVPGPLLRNLQAIDDVAMEAMFGVEGDVVLYGEGYGPKIQKGGGDYRNDPGFILFDVCVGSWWLTREGVEQVAAELDIPVVPIILRGTFAQAIMQVKPTFESHVGNRLAEGLVGRPPLELFDRKGERLITKIKTKDWAHV